MTRTRLSIGWLFIGPWLLGFGVFVFLPFLATLYLSFCRYNILSPPQWVGLANYRELFLLDPLFVKSLANTLIYAGVAVPLGIVVGIMLALLLNTNIRGISVYRTIYYLPSIVPVVATSILWNWMLNPQMGLINSVLRWVGWQQGPAWLNSPVWSKPALILMSLWGVGGSMIIYLAGLKDIPLSLYEAAIVDGANIMQRTRHITLPMLTPVIFFNLVMGIISSFQYFTQAYIMTVPTGGPENSTMFYSLYLFLQAWSYLNMGYASAMAFILFLIILVITLLVFKTQKRWVHYENT